MHHDPSSRRWLARSMPGMGEAGDDTPYTLYELASGRHDPRVGQEMAEEFERRRAIHGALLEEKLSLEPSEGLSVTALPTETVLTLDTSQGRRISDEQLVSRGLPVAPDGEATQAIVINGPSGDRSVTALFKDGRGSVVMRKLQDHRASEDSQELNPDWVGLGWAFPERYGALPGAEVRGDWISIAPDKDSSKDTVIIHPEVNARERIANNSSADFDKKYRRGRRVAGAAFALASVVGVPSAVGAAVDSVTEDKPDLRAGGIEYDNPAYNNEVGLERFNEAYGYYQAGDHENLQRIIDNSVFDFEMDTEYENQISHAEDMQSITSALNGAMKSVGVEDVTVSIPLNETEKYIGLTSGDTEAAKAAALGILDFIGEKGPLLGKTGGLEIQIVDTVRSDRQEDNRADGHYDPADSENSIPIIRLSAGVKDMPGLLAHEIGHDYSHYSHSDNSPPVISSSYIRAINPPGTTYGAAEGSDAALRVGQEVFSDYAATDVSEDISETIEAIEEGDMPDISSEEASSVLEQKYKGILASLEAEFPGVSAVVFKEELRTQPSPSATEEAVDSAKTYLGKVRERAAAITSAFVLLGAAATVYSKVQANRRDIRDSAGQSQQ